MTTRTDLPCSEDCWKEKHDADNIIGALRLLYRLGPNKADSEIVDVATVEYREAAYARKENAALRTECERLTAWQDNVVAEIGKILDAAPVKRVSDAALGMVAVALVASSLITAAMVCVAFDHPWWAIPFLVAVPLVRVTVGRAGKKGGNDGA